MSYQNSSRNPKIVRPRIDEEAYLTLCSWVGKSNSVKIMVADKVIKAQRDRITELSSRIEFQSRKYRTMRNYCDSEIDLKESAEDKAKSWKYSFLILLSINIASLVFWLLAK